jgi:regulator of sigma E protease
MTFLIFFIALSIMIFVHELGHFVMARINGLKVEEFGFGLPPRLIGKKVGETIYSINALPLGGFVRIWGMENRVEEDKKRAFYTQSSKVQFLILAAGVVMNFLLAIGVFSVVYGIQGVPQSLDVVKIVQTAEESPARNAGIKAETEIVAVIVDDQETEVNNSEQFIQVIDEHLGQEVSLVAKSGEEYTLTPRKDPPEGQGALGVVITDSELKKIALWRRIPLGVWYGLKEGFFWGMEIIKGLGRMIGSLFQGRVPSDVGGPIAIYTASRQIFQRQGLLDVIHFFAIVSVNLAIVNIVPIPGTDGWHAGVLGFEIVRGRKLSEKTKTKINQAAMIFILLLSALIIAADVKRFIL